jgi:phenylacetate-CoA ligase
MVYAHCQHYLSLNCFPIALELINFVRRSEYDDLRAGPNAVSNRKVEYIQKMMSRFYHRFLIPAFETGLKRRQTFRYLRELNESQWLAPEELRNIQLVALRKLLRHAADNCPYYAESWRRLNLNADQIESSDDLVRWPLVDRETIRKNLHNMRNTIIGDPLILNTTGGSTGTPLQFYLNADSNDRRMAAWHRGYSWAGAAPGTRQVYLWGVPLGERPWRARWKDHFYQRWIYRRQMLNTFNLNETTMSDYLRKFDNYHPDVLVAYTNPLYAFARWLDENKRAPYSPRSIVVGAEKLHGFQRELIERVFRAPVFETYGSREFMLIGAECDRHEGLHLTMENLLVEIVDEEGHPTPVGEEGNVVITDLYNYGMPFIRYITGDRAIAGFTQCSCGRGLHLLKKVVGRQLDILTTPSGRQIPGELFPHLIKDFPAVRRFQVVQSCPSQIILMLVVDKSSWSPAWRERLTREIQKHLDDTLQLTLQEVDDIRLTAAGKLRVVVNECKQQEIAANASRAL